MNNLIEDLALLSVVLDPSDSQSFEMAASILEELSSAASQLNNEILTLQVSSALDSYKRKDYHELIKLIGEIVSSSQGASTASSSQNDDQSSVADLSEELDSELISEFVSTHSLEIQDFESELLSLVANSEEKDSAAVTRAVKSYLHNIKGDAGSVGFIGISKVAHLLEDELVTKPIEQMVEPLIAFKEWVISTMNSVADGQQPETSHSQFLASIKDQENSAVEVADEPNLEPSVTIAAEATTYEISSEEELLNDFLVEAQDHINITEAILLEQKESYSLDDVNTIFRAVHSIKGGAGYFNLVDVVSSSHITETLLDKARSGETEFDPTLRELMLEYVDHQRDLFDKIRKAITGDRLITSTPEIIDFASRVQYRYEHGATATPKAPIAKTIQPVESEAALPTLQNSAPAQKSEKRETVEYIKVDTKRFDKLLEYIGEMVTASSMLIRNCRLELPQDQKLGDNCHQLEQIVREVQEIGMSLRLVPIKGLFQKMSRVVWDTAKKVNKPIQFHVYGEETELDRTLVEQLADPLMHMVRNAVDHGIESAEQRIKAGKEPSGNVTLRAYHKGGSINVEIQDDGKGLDPKQLIEKATEKGIIEPGKILSDEEAFALIFAPGFSTAATITDVSGRGVGMDVVRKNIESLRGKVKIISEIGKGSTFRIELPLTLAIVDGIEISVKEKRYLVPTTSIIEITQIAEDDYLSSLDKGETLRFRDEYLPIYSLARVLGVSTDHRIKPNQTAIVVQSGSQQAAFTIDDVFGQVSTVIKSIGSIFKDSTGLAGCAIMPDGQIGIILDINGLIERAQGLEGNYYGQEVIELSEIVNNNELAH